MNIPGGEIQRAQLFAKVDLLKEEINHLNSVIDTLIKGCQSMAELDTRIIADIDTANKRMEKIEKRFDIINKRLRHLENLSARQSRILRAYGMNTLGNKPN